MTCHELDERLDDWVDDALPAAAASEVEAHLLACGLCREVCPERAVHPKMQDIHHMYEVIASECTGCADCLPYCPEPGALAQY